MKTFNSLFRVLAIIAALILAFTANTQVTTSMIVCVCIIFSYLAFHAAIKSIL